MSRAIRVSTKAVRRVWNRARWHALSPSLPRRPDGAMMAHIGCGDIDAPGFINIDARRANHVHFVVHDLHEIRFLPAGSMALVYMSHVLEHVGLMSIRSVLREMARVLRPTGILRLSVPDFDLVLAAYEQTHRNIDGVASVLMGGQDYPENYHFAVFNRESLTAHLRETGFTDVKHWDPDDCDYHAFADWANTPISIGGQGFPISLNLEARRP